MGPDLAQAKTRSLEERKLRLEEKKHDLERDKFDHDRVTSGLLKFFNNNFGIIITAIIGAATVVVSYLQLEISRATSTAQIALQQRQIELSDNAGKAQLHLQKAISDAQLELEKSKAVSAKDKDERAFQFDLARLLLEKHNEINTQEIWRIHYMRDVVISTLPIEFGSRITRKMADMASNDRIRAAWNDGYVQLQLSVLAQSPQKPGPAGPGTGPTPDSKAAVKGVITVEYVMQRFPQIERRNGTFHLERILGEAEAARMDTEGTAVLLALALHNTRYLSYMDDRLLREHPSQLLRNVPVLGQVLAPPEGTSLAWDRRDVANKIYGGLTGNVEPDDGWRYRGRGYFQTVGRANYKRSGELIGVDLEANPDELLKVDVAAREAVATIAKMDRPTVLELLKSRTGSLAGLALVQAHYEKLMPGAQRVTEGLTIDDASGRAN